MLDALRRGDDVPLRELAESIVAQAQKMKDAAAAAAATAPAVPTAPLRPSTP